jgi:hypothetical protein
VQQDDAQVKELENLRKEKEKEGFDENKKALEIATEIQVDNLLV